MNSTSKSPESDGKLFLANLEVDVVDHCNLACRSCSHLSPIARKYFASETQIANDLSMLSANMRVGRLKVVGGEPLLHPNLEGILRAIRSAALCDRIALITNGLLLGRIGAAIFALVDEVVVSNYVSAPADSEVLREVSALAAKNGACFRVDEVTSFREMFRFDHEDTEGLTPRIYKTCEIAHVYRCVSVRSGYLYKCPQAHAIARIKGADSTPDGIRIARDSNFVQQLQEYLSRADPLQACSSCLGTVGKLANHKQIARSFWKEHLTDPVSISVDYARLASLENAGCITSVGEGLSPRRA